MLRPSSFEPILVRSRIWPTFMRDGTQRVEHHFHGSSVGQIRHVRSGTIRAITPLLRGGRHLVADESFRFMAM